MHHSDLLNTNVELQLNRPKDAQKTSDFPRELNQSISKSDVLADLLVALRGDEHLHAGLVHIVDVGPVSLDLGVFYATGQAVDGACSPDEEKKNLFEVKVKCNLNNSLHIYGKFIYICQISLHGY